MAAIGRSRRSGDRAREMMLPRDRVTMERQQDVVRLNPNGTTPIAHQSGGMMVSPDVRPSSLRLRRFRAAQGSSLRGMASHLGADVSDLARPCRRRTFPRRPVAFSTRRYMASRRLFNARPLTRERIVIGATPNHIVLQIHRFGGSVGEVADRPVRISRGRVALCGLRRPLDVEATTSDPDDEPRDRIASPTRSARIVEPWRPSEAAEARLPRRQSPSGCRRSEASIDVCEQAHASELKRMSSGLIQAVISLDRWQARMRAAAHAA